MEMLTEGSVLVVRGDVDATGTAPLRSALYTLLEPERCDVVVDLSGAERVDVRALRTLAVASRLARRRGRRVRLRGCCPAVVALLRRSRMIRVVELDEPAPGRGTGV